LFPASHAASAALINRALFRKDDPAATIVGSLLPDVIDKSMAWVLRVTKSSHHAGHTPLAAIAFTTIAATVVGRQRAAVFGMAYLAHLAGDELHHGRVPWLMPLSRRKRLRHGESQRRWLLVFEAPAVLVLYALYSRRADSPG
jgi:hypothetical protein